MMFLNQKIRSSHGRNSNETDRGKMDAFQHYTPTISVYNTICEIFVCEIYSELVCNRIVSDVGRV